MVMFAIFPPAVEIILVAVAVIVREPDKLKTKLLPLKVVKLPAQVMLELPVIAPLIIPADTAKDKQAKVPDVDIFGLPDKVSTITASAMVGTEAPPAPPLDVDQFVVLDASQVPLPPTQYLLAII
jgi:hypothetical protein